MTKYNMKKVAEAFAKGDQFAVNYTRTLAEYVRGSINEIWVNIARLECLNHLRLW
jgi:hypothetical protein